MANCILNQDLLRSNTCGYSLGEIARIFLANYEDVSATTVSTASGTEVTAITMASGKQFYKIEPAKNSATWTDELVVADSGAKYRTHTLNFNFLGVYDAEMVDTLDALSLGKYIAVVKRADGAYVMLGRVAGLEATVATVGGSSDDSVVNGIQVTLSANAAEAALPLSSEAIATVEGWLTCESGDSQCTWVSYELPSAITFYYTGEEKSYNMQMNCSWTIVDNTYEWLEYSSQEFEACEAATLTLTTVTQSRDNLNGEFIIQDIEGETQATIPVYWRPSNIIVDKTRTVFPEAQTVVFDLNVPVAQLRVESSIGTLTTSFDAVNNRINVNIPANGGSEEVVYSVTLLSDRTGTTDTLTITQTVS